MQITLQELEQQRSDLQKSENHRNLLSQQMAMIRETEALGTAQGSHPLNTLSQRYIVYKRTRDDFENSKKALTEKSNQNKKIMKDYFKSSNGIFNHLIDLELISCIGSEFDLIQEFLENSPQHQIFIECDLKRKELNTFGLQQISTIRSAFEALLQYSAVVKFFPKGFHENHRLSKYSQWCLFLVENPSVQSCRDVVKQYQTSLGDSSVKPSTQQVISFSIQVQTILREATIKDQKIYERIKSELESGDFKSVYDQSKMAISLFLEQEKCAMETIAVNPLYELNEKFLRLENAAVSSGENLIDLTSNGKWFLDELCIVSSSITEICDSILVNDENQFLNQSIDCLKSTSRVFECLRRINYDFMTLVLSETIQQIISEDKNTLEMISSVSNLQKDLLPLPELLTNLNLHLRCTIMNVSSPHFDSCLKVKELRKKLNVLKDESENKIFPVFNKLFEDLEYEQSCLMKSVDKLILQPEWKKINEIKESINLANLIINPETRVILEDIFLVKRLETMIEFFTLSLQMAYAFKGQGVCTVYDDDRLCRPIKRFIADHIFRLVLGIGPYSVSLLICNLLQKIGLNIEGEIDLNDIGAQNKISLDELRQKGVEFAAKNNNFSQLILNHATSLCSNLEISWRKKEFISHLQETAQIQTIGLKRLQLLLAAHHWLHEEIIATNPSLMNFSPIQRPTIMLQLSNSILNFKTLKIAIQKLRDDLTVLVGKIVQLLKWAAGTNPNLTEILTSFEKSAQEKRKQLDENCLLAAIALKNSTTVLTYEGLRVKTQESLENDQIFLNLVSRWEKSCTMAKSCSTAVSPVEEALVELLDPEGPIDSIWLSNVAALIDDMTDQIQSEIAKFEKDISDSQDNLQKAGHRLRSLICLHHRMAADIIALLKTTLKDNPKTKEYLIKYKQFLETISELHLNALSKDFTEEVVCETRQQIIDVIPNVNRIYDGLFLFENEMQDCADKPVKKTVAVRENLSESPNRKNQKGEFNFFSN